MAKHKNRRGSDDVESFKNADFVPLAELDEIFSKPTTAVTTHPHPQSSELTTKHTNSGTSFGQDTQLFGNYGESVLRQHVEKSVSESDMQTKNETPQGFVSPDDSIFKKSPEGKKFSSEVTIPFSQFNEMKKQQTDFHTKHVSANRSNRELNIPLAAKTMITQPNSVSLRDDMTSDVLINSRENSEFPIQIYKAPVAASQLPISFERFQTMRENDARLHMKYELASKDKTSLREEESLQTVPVNQKPILSKRVQKTQAPTMAFTSKLNTDFFNSYNTLTQIFPESGDIDLETLRKEQKVRVKSAFGKASTSTMSKPKAVVAANQDAVVYNSPFSHAATHFMQAEHVEPSKRSGALSSLHSTRAKSTTLDETLENPTISEPVRPIQPRTARSPKKVAILNHTDTRAYLSLIEKHPAFSGTIDKGTRFKIVHDHYAETGGITLNDTEHSYPLKAFPTDKFPVAQGSKKLIEAPRMGHFEVNYDRNGNPRIEVYSPKPMSGPEVDTLRRINKIKKFGKNFVGPALGLAAGITLATYLGGKTEKSDASINPIAQSVQVESVDEVPTYAPQNPKTQLELVAEAEYDFAFGNKKATISAMHAGADFVENRLEVKSVIDENIFDTDTRYDIVGYDRTTGNTAPTSMAILAFTTESDMPKMTLDEIIATPTNGRGEAITYERSNKKSQKVFERFDKLATYGQVEQKLTAGLKPIEKSNIQAVHELIASGEKVGEFHETLYSSAVNKVKQFFGIGNTAKAESATPNVSEVTKASDTQSNQTVAKTVESSKTGIPKAQELSIPSSYVPNTTVDSMANFDLDALVSTEDASTNYMPLADAHKSKTHELTLPQVPQIPVSQNTPVVEKTGQLEKLKGAYQAAKAKVKKFSDYINKTYDYAEIHPVKGKDLDGSAYILGDKTAHTLAKTSFHEVVEDRNETRDRIVELEKKINAYENSELTLPELVTLPGLAEERSSIPRGAKSANATTVPRSIDTTVYNTPDVEVANATTSGKSVYKKTSLEKIHSSPKGATNSKVRYLVSAENNTWAIKDYDKDHEIDGNDVRLSAFEKVGGNKSSNQYLVDDLLAQSGIDSNAITKENRERAYTLNELVKGEDHFEVKSVTSTDGGLDYKVSADDRSLNKALRQLVHHYKDSNTQVLVDGKVVDPKAIEAEWVSYQQSSHPSTQTGSYKSSASVMSEIVGEGEINSMLFPKVGQIQNTFSSDSVIKGVEVGYDLDPSEKVELENRKFDGFEDAYDTLLAAAVHNFTSSGKRFGKLEGARAIDEFESFYNDRVEYVNGQKMDFTTLLTSAGKVIDDNLRNQIYGAYLSPKGRLSQAD